MANTIDLSKLSVDELKALSVAAAKAAKSVVALPKGFEGVLKSADGKGRVTLSFDLFTEPSVDNGYGKLIIAMSKRGNTEYIAVGAIHGGPFDGCPVEVTYRARITPPEGYTL